ncbi:MAG TPA: hypothetical protein PKA05_14995 [Roseiflexaceae bacterium]|nr:hypothetical protein [Roseiflexaceae bacterium]HMP41685.1 hypothetical protein [Roseiflexaceae bacterium]
MERIAALHANLLTTILLLVVVLIGWGMILLIRNRPPPRAADALLAITTLLVAANALLGVALLTAGRRPAQLELHLIYGLIAALLLPAAHYYGRDHPPRARLLIMIAACGFLAAILLRALQTGVSFN